MRFAIVGPGKVGTALARLLRRGGYEFVGAAGRSLESAEAACAFAGGGRATTQAEEITRTADLVLLTVPDDSIEPVCQKLAGSGAFGAGTIVAHCSGALPSSILRAAADAGAHVGSLHPMQSFASAEQALRTLPGSACCVEGDPEAVRVLTDAARALDCHVVAIPTAGKP
ncbi:MAG: NAD(P)-binding domain-containing protein, partial [Candidatus Brocadiia bacterium]